MTARFRLSVPESRATPPEGSPGQDNFPHTLQLALTYRDQGNGQTRQQVHNFGLNPASLRGTDVCCLAFQELRLTPLAKMDESEAGVLSRMLSLARIGETIGPLLANMGLFAVRWKSCLTRGTEPPVVKTELNTSNLLDTRLGFFNPTFHSGTMLGIKRKEH